ncbi:hypothetical protein ACXR2W_14275 [Leucobacter sp. HY1908]
MNPFRLASRTRPPPGAARRWRANISAAVRARAAPLSTEQGAAIAVPWRVVSRSPDGDIEVAHSGRAPAHSVRFALAGGGMLGLSLPGTVLPGERVTVLVRHGEAGVCAAAPDAMLVLRWFEPDGREYLWPIALE